MAGNYTPQQIAQMRQMQQLYQSPQFQNNAPAPFQHQANAVLNWLGLTGPNNVGHQLVQAFDPTTKAGAANILASVFGGGDFIGEGGFPVENPGMPGSYEPYSTAKAAAGGNISMDRQPASANAAIKFINLAKRAGQAGANWFDPQVVLKNQQHVHDTLFGGEVHAKGAIPPKPTEPGIPARGEQGAGVKPTNAKQDAIARFLKAQGFEMHPGKVFGKLVGYKDQGLDARHYFHGEESYLVTPHDVHKQPEALDKLTGGHPLKANAARTKALKRLISKPRSKYGNN